MIHPQPVTPASIDVARAERHLLPNGAALYLLPADEFEVLRVSFVFRAGSAVQQVPFSASTTANLLSEGTRSMTARRIAEQLDFYGSWYDVNLDRDYAYINFAMLSKFAVETLRIAAEILLHPTFPEEELRTYCAKRRQRLEIDRTKVDVEAREAFAAALFGARHPYGTSSPAEAYDRLTRGEVEAFYRRYYTAERCIVVCSGRIGPTERAAVEALRAAARDLKEGLLDTVVTAPIDKETVQSDDFRFTGHTEFFGAEFGGEPMMIMCSDILRVGLVTKHIPVSEISRSITREKIVADLLTLRRSLVEDFGVVEPRIAVMALNPHAGDGGLLGREEEEIIRPAIVEAFSKGVLAFGPFAADGLFAGGGYTRYDGILAMYHDQGLAPFKSLSPDGVNFTAGLPVVRTSPDHGTAYDIAGQDKADAQSMRSAIYAAIDIVEHRRAWTEWSRNPLQRAEREKGGRDISVKDLPQTERED